MKPMTISELIELHNYLASINKPAARVKAAAAKVLDHFLRSAEGLTFLGPISSE